jgi:hypothetical protein
MPVRPWLALAIVHTLLVAASIVAGALLKHGATVVNPYSPAEEARRFFADNPLSIRVSTFFLFGSSVPLGIYAATVVSRLRFLGVFALPAVTLPYSGVLQPRSRWRLPASAVVSYRCRKGRHRWPRPECSTSRLCCSAECASRWLLRFWPREYRLRVTSSVCFRDG